MHFASKAWIHVIFLFHHLMSDIVKIEITVPCYALMSPSTIHRDK